MKKLQLIVLALSLSLMVAAGSGSEAPEVTTKMLMEKIEKIRSGSDDETRVEDATSLERIIVASRHARPQPVTEDVIKGLEDLLKENGGVRFWAALALGKIGHRAKHAVPALKEALEAEWQSERGLVFRPSLDSMGVICDALHKIGARKPRTCRYAN